MEIYAIPLEGSGQFIIYRPLLGLAFVGNRAMLDLALKLASETHADDISEKDQAEQFLGRIGFCEPDPSPPAANQPDREGRFFLPITVVLLLTNQCQLRCEYCYALAGEYPKEQLTLDYAKIGIDQVYQNAIELGRDMFTVTYHGGGEPTTSWKVLKGATEYARQKRIHADVSMTSNGTWSRSKLAWIMSNLDSLSLSMDGSPVTQDRQRPFASGRGSSNLVMKNISELDRERFPYGIRMTAAEPWEQFPEDVRFICEETSCQSMQVEPSFNTKRGGHGDFEASGGKRFAEAFLEAYDIAAKAGRRLAYSGARLGLTTSTFCTAPFNALIINPHGTLVTCYEITNPSHPLYEISTIGQIRDGEISYDYRVRFRLHEFMNQRRDSCKECFCYWSCAGDCYTRTFSPSPGGHLEHSARCEINRWITQGILLKNLANSGGVWRFKNRFGAPPTIGFPVEVQLS